MSAVKQEQHQKHKQLQKPEWGSFGRMELSILGSSCSVIGELAARLIYKLSSRYNLAYVDAEHASKNPGQPTFEGLLYTDRDNSQRFDFYHRLNNYHIKSQFNEQDLVFINGNHFSAENQIVIIDPHKSQEIKQEELTDVRMIILSEQTNRVPDRIKVFIKDFDTIPVLNINETDQIADEVEQFIRQKTPLISGLVLAGGKSTRMHTDKTVLEYHGKPQRSYLYELLGNFCDEVFISCREEQAGEIPDSFNCITDSFLGMGPMGALLSAFRQDPNRAWFSVACDLPLLSAGSLKYLVEHRNPSKFATAFSNPDSSFPEPLITIWEPKSYALLLHFLSLGYTCPRKVLINSQIEMLEAPDPIELKNANRPEEYAEAKKILAANL